MALLGGCGLSEFRERRQLAELLIGTPERVLAAGTARFVMQQDLVPIELSGRQDSEILLLPFRFYGELDADAHRVVLTVDLADLGTGTVPGLEQLVELQAQLPVRAPEGRGPGPSLEVAAETVPLFVFDDLVAYAHSVEAMRQAGGPQQRPWARIDLAELDDPADAMPALGFNAINPVVLLELLAGTLSGSVRRMGAEEVGGVITTRYEANLDREKAFRDSGDERVMELEGIFELMRVGSVVVPATVWLDQDDLPRRVEVRFEQRLDRRNAFELLVRMEIAGYGSPVDIRIPGPEETVEVSGFVSLLRQAGLG
jgi:hypothetical protein